MHYGDSGNGLYPTLLKSRRNSMARLLEKSDMQLNNRISGLVSTLFIGMTAEQLTRMIVNAVRTGVTSCSLKKQRGYGSTSGFSRLCLYIKCQWGRCICRQNQQ